MAFTDMQNSMRYSVVQSLICALQGPCLPAILFFILHHESMYTLTSVCIKLRSRSLNHINLITSFSSSNT